MKKNIVSNMWNGNCPECALQGKTARMRINQHDFFECRDSGLQICLIPGVQAVILNFRGTGKFREAVTYGDDIAQGEILSPQNTGRPPFNHPPAVFGETVEIENYIKTVQVNDPG